MKARGTQRNQVERDTAKHGDPRLANELFPIGLRLGQ